MPFFVFTHPASSTPNSAKQSSTTWRISTNQRLNNFKLWWPYIFPVIACILLVERVFVCKRKAISLLTVSINCIIYSKNYSKHELVMRWFKSKLPCFLIKSVLLFSWFSFSWYSLEGIVIIIHTASVGMINLTLSSV